MCTITSTLNATAKMKCKTNNCDANNFFANWKSPKLLPTSVPSLLLSPCAPCTSPICVHSVVAFRCCRLINREALHFRLGIMICMNEVERRRSSDQLEDLPRPAYLSSALLRSCVRSELFIRSCES